MSTALHALPNALPVNIGIDDADPVADAVADPALTEAAAA